MTTKNEIPFCIKPGPPPCSVVIFSDNQMGQSHKAQEENNPYV